MEVNMSGREGTLCARNEQKAVDDCTQNRKTEVNIDVGEQPALSSTNTCAADSVQREYDSLCLGDANNTRISSG
jgi:hypothetical protein